MLTFGATAHFIVPDLDAGGQILHQETFTITPGTPLQEVILIGQTDYEPRCLVEGLRPVLDHEVDVQFHKVTSVALRPQPTRHEADDAAVSAHARLGARGTVPPPSDPGSRNGALATTRSACP
jgi:hypothetical protein